MRFGVGTVSRQNTVAPEVIASRFAMEGVAPRSSPDDIRPVAPVQNLVVMIYSAREDVVVSQTRLARLIGLEVAEDVVVAARGDRVVARSAVGIVLAVAAIDVVIAVAAEERIGIVAPK